MSVQSQQEHYSHTHNPIGKRFELKIEVASPCIF